ncbi:glycoside hydrolase family 81 protein [Tortispora caseinolytica NRRL Y-17796]|uniref:glucan endo-1,3-beta-D-glucosidase n=1 Tax=Tortispora caseinolytica NRRL Y-17796 TaxID=767744 RepID=A0A1E4T9Q0_9ASCO|nr:glycoside hydrolase family 81 protein [Tortispora caseinolytica NRRL Y-17796]
MSSSPKVLQTSGDMFTALTTSSTNPATTLGSQQHPLALKDQLTDQSPTETNKFYGNWLVDDQSGPVWTHPYSMWWNKSAPGMAISYRPRSAFSFGGTSVEGSSQYYFAPVGVISFQFSAAELTTSNTIMQLDTPEMMSINCNLVNSNNTEQKIWFPTVQGMGFITAKYIGTTPIISSAVGFKSVAYVGLVNNNVQFFRITLYDDSNWLLFAFLSPSVTNEGKNLSLSLQGGSLRGSMSYGQCVIQVAYCPTSADESAYIDACGVYVRTVTVNGSSNNSTGTVEFQYHREETTTRPVLQFALPHQIDLFDSATQSTATSIYMDSTSKGTLRAYHTTKFTLVSTLPNRSNMYFLPNTKSSETSLDAPYLNFNQASLNRLSSISDLEIGFTSKSHETIVNEIVNACNLDSVYFSGKAIDKYAFLLLSLKYVLKDDTRAAIVASGLKSAFALWVSNTQQTKLVYDSKFRGIVSVSGLASSGADFGNGYYNDHHFHYGYFVHAAAVLALYDPSWIANPANKTWVDMLVRDIANPSEDDAFFPVSRAFDWFHGHSWAKGLFGSGDGKDEESTSEDYHHIYGIMLWAMVTGDSSMEHRAAMQLAIMKQSFNHYFLYTSGNNTMPSATVANKVSGILFENKVDHATYFGMNREYIHGIQMLPLTPASVYIRQKQFVQEEWDLLFASYNSSVNSGWRGILYQNLALVNSPVAYGFFFYSDYNANWIDGGTTWTYSLVFTGALTL